jgi:hypothetical protein
MELRKINAKSRHRHKFRAVWVKSPAAQRDRATVRY